MMVCRCLLVLEGSPLVCTAGQKMNVSVEAHFTQCGYEGENLTLSLLTIAILATV